MFDITNYKSYENSKYWVNFFQDKRFEKNYSIILCGNKSDLDSKRVITVDEILDYSKTIKAHYYEISLKTKNNFGEMKNYLFNKFNLDHNLKVEETKKQTSCLIF